MDKQTAIIIIAKITSVASDLTENFQTPNSEYCRAIIEMSSDLIGIIHSDID